MALSAVIIGISALFVSMYQASIMHEQQRIMHEQQRASVWPYLEVGAGINNSGLYIRVMNQGVGPARIQTVEATIDGAVVRDWSEVLWALLEDSAVGYNRRTVNKRVLAPEAVLAIFELKHPQADTVWHYLDRLEMHFCYCSVYQDCWTTTLKGFDIHQVEACERDEARQFNN